MPTTPRATRSGSQPTPQKATPPPSRRSMVPVVEIPARASASARASSSTPRSTRSTSILNTHPHHHKTADELALEEAEEILDHEHALEGEDARSRRHRRLSRLRGEAEGSQAGQSIDGDHEEMETATEAGSEIVVMGRETEMVKADTVEDADTEAVSDTIGQEADQASVSKGEEGDEVASSVVSSDSDIDSESDSDSDNESDDGSSATSEDGDSDDEDLEKLLQAARVSAAKPPPAENKGESGVLGGDGDVVSFDQERKQREEPIPDISITKLPKPHMIFPAEGGARAADAPLILAGPSRPRSQVARVDERSSKGEKVPELDAQPFERALSKREKAAQPRKATASELWSTLPAPKSDLLPQMKRDYQALSLANSLDPKRFMKGGNKGGKIPETFAIGTLVEAPRHLQDTTLTREKQYRPGQIVQSLIRDEQTESYAKRKYGDLQSKRMENGRGKGWKKQKGW